MERVVQGRSYRRGRQAPQAILLAAALGVMPAFAATGPAPTNEHPPPGTADHLFGTYLAGRHAEKLRDYPAAAAWFDKAITGDPDAPELISRTFLMAVGAGNWERAQK